MKQLDEPVFHVVIKHYFLVKTDTVQSIEGIWGIKEFLVCQKQTFVDGLLNLNVTAQAPTMLHVLNN